MIGKNATNIGQPKCSETDLLKKSQTCLIFVQSGPNWPNSKTYYFRVCRTVRQASTAPVRAPPPVKIVRLVSTVVGPPHHPPHVPQAATPLGAPPAARCVPWATHVSAPPRAPCSVTPAPTQPAQVSEGILLFKIS